MDWRGVVVAGFVLLAGCNGIALGEPASSPTETVTPAPVEVTEGTRATVAPTAPPGVSMDGSIDLSALLGAHRAYVTDRADSYTWVARVERTFEDGNISGRSYTRRLHKSGDEFVVEHVVGDRRTPRKYIPHGTGVSSRNLTLYVPTATETGYMRSVVPGRTTYRTVEKARPYTRYVFADEMLRRFLSSEGVSVRRIERNGQVLYRLYATRPGPQMSGSALRKTVSNYTATAYVTETGFVRTMVVDYDRRLDGRIQHTRLRYDYSAVGETSVTRPAWIDRVPTPTATTTARNETATSTPEATVNATESVPDSPG